MPLAFNAAPNPLLLLEVPAGDTEEAICVLSTSVAKLLAKSKSLAGGSVGIFISLALTTISPVEESNSLFGIASQGSKDAKDNGSLIAAVTVSI